MVRNTYRRKSEIGEKLCLGKTAVTNLVQFLKKHANDRYDPDVVVYGRKTVLVDEDAAFDAFKYWDDIELGLAPEYKGRR